MSCNGNYPPGAQFNPQAPWNEPEDLLTEEDEEYLNSEADYWLDEDEENNNI